MLIIPAVTLGRPYLVVSDVRIFEHCLQRKARNKNRPLLLNRIGGKFF